MVLAAVVVASASAAGAGLAPPIIRGGGQATALAASGARIAAAATCDVRVADIGSKPRLLKRYGYCREDRFDSAVIGLWLGKRTIIEEVLISPSPHGDTYQLWSGPVRGSLHQIGGDWGWTDSDEPPTYGCDRMVAAGGGVVASAPVANDLGDGTACTGATSTKVTLAGAVNRSFTLAGAWGPIGTNGKRVALVEFDSSGDRTGRLALVGTDGKRLGAPAVSAADVKGAYGAWLTPIGLFLDAKRGLVGPGGRVLLKRYVYATIGEGRAIYVRGRLLRARRLKGGPDRLVTRLPEANPYLAAGSFGVAVMTGTVGERLAVYRIPWHTIDQVLPR